ncbi:hypothetical protein MTR_4g079150 [Medicago truncatula]|uniref:Uncharacterized protein n=1 Tax=Medicago truncatula TaxID=3880 RepID=G7JUX9_MEDTR|nr:hypothetical protein MTR_4g079150 [Medicago truncatula]
MSSSERKRCVKSPTSGRRLSDNVFISEGNPHLINRFCTVVFGSLVVRILLFQVEKENKWDVRDSNSSLCI